MARLARLCPIGVPQHIIQRGNNRQVCFNGHEDITAYTGWLKKYSVKFSVDIHAWVFMTNHVHLLVTPQANNAISLMMQSLGRQYVRYYNYTYKRSGTLWEGRFKSCLVQSTHYLLQCYRYIELNPVRAGMVASPEQYQWSSYRSNAFGEESILRTPHSEYLALAATDSERLLRYQELFHLHLESDALNAIREAVSKGLALGDDRFKAQIEENYNRRVTSQKIGRRPVKTLL